MHADLEGPVFPAVEQEFNGIRYFFLRFMIYYNGKGINPAMALLDREKKNTPK